MPTATNTRSTNTERISEKKGSVTKSGNLTRDPELRYGASGTAYANFGLAVNRPKVAGDWAGERVTEFYEVTCFKSLAENVAECLSKGDRVVVEGEAEVEHWADGEGKDRITKRILANAIGAELRFTTVAIHKPERRTTKPIEDDDEEPF